MNYRIWVLFTIIVSLNFLDAATTDWLINAYGSIELERNPIVYYILAYFGGAGPYIFKMVLCVLLGMALYKYQLTVSNDKWVLLLLKLTAFVYTVVVGLNFAAIFLT